MDGLVFPLQQQLAALQAEVSTLQARITQLEQQNQALRQENQALRDQLDQAQRAAARQAAPFRRRDTPKLPDDQKRGCCTRCGAVPSSPLADLKGHRRGPGPARPPRSRPGSQPKQAVRADDAQDLPRAEAPDRPGAQPRGLTLAVQRTAQRVQASFASLVTEVRAAAAAFVDETSWYVGAPGPWLWTFTTADTTVYHVDRSRSRQVVLELLGAAFAGTLVSDCLGSYENLPYRMHECVAHHQKAIGQARAEGDRPGAGRPDTTDPSYLNQWKLLSVMVSVLWKYRATLGEPEFLRQRQHLEVWLDRLLAEPRSQPGDVAIQQRIGKRRGVVLGCLDGPAAEPTNNRAERSLRDLGVIARKLSCGNKTERGKAAWACRTSLAVTCQQRGHDFVSWLAACLPLAAPVIPVPPAR